VDNSAPNYVELSDALARPPLRRRLGVIGLQGVTVADALTGGLPSRPWASERAGDAGEGRDLAVRLSRVDDDGSYRPHPNLPSAAKLDYINKLGSASLLSLAFVLLLVVAVVRPRRAAQLLTRGAKRKAGMH
jgi:hypothetical protein